MLKQQSWCFVVVAGGRPAGMNVRLPLASYEERQRVTVAATAAVRFKRYMLAAAFMDASFSEEGLVAFAPRGEPAASSFARGGFTTRCETRQAASHLDVTRSRGDVAEGDQAHSGSRNLRL